MGGVIGGRTGGRIGGVTGGRMGTIGGRIGPRQRTLATSTAALASTRPEPVARSVPTPAAAPEDAGLQLPVVTSTAVRTRMSRTSAGVSRAQAWRTSAAAPASWGAAAEVPLMAAQPSLLAVSSALGWVPPARSMSMVQLGCSGSMM